MKKRNLLLGLGILLMISIVLAVPPSTPTFLLPANESIFNINNVNLTCSGSGDINYTFTGDNAVLQSSNLTTFNWVNLGFTRHNWTCNSLEVTTSLKNFTQRTSLLAYLSFDNANYTAPVIRDLTLQGRNGTNFGLAATGFTGIHLEAFNFTATDIVNISDDSQLRLENGGTINLWVEMKSIPNGARVFSKASNAAQGDGGYELMFDVSGNFLALFIDGSEAARTTNDINGTGFHMITVLIQDSPAISSIFINATNVTSSGTAVSIPDSSAFGLGIGNRYDGRDRPFGDVIDEFAIWNTTLDANDITELYNNTHGIFFITSLINITSIETSPFAANRTFTTFNITENDAGNLGLRLIFFNESNGENINGSINTFDLDLATNDTEQASFLFTNSTSKENWTFQLNPQEISIGTNGTVSYTGSTFQQRSVGIEKTLNGTGITNVSLFLLPTSDGIFVTFQTISTSDQAISGVNILAEARIDSVFQEVASGLTDDAGAITLFLNPNTLHRITASKSGFETFTTEITPTSSTFTITMTSTTTFNATNFNQGITFNILPINVTLSNFTNYTFGFNITSQNLSLENFGFNLINSTDDILISLTNSTSSSGGFVFQELNTTNNTQLRMEYFWTAQGSSQNATKFWTVVFTQQGDFSLKTFFDDLRVFNHSGFSDFTRSMIAFILTIVIVASVSLVTGIVTPTAITGIITALTWLFEYVGMYAIIGREWFLTSVMFMLFIAFWIYETTR